MLVFLTCEHFGDAFPFSDIRPRLNSPSSIDNNFNECKDREMTLLSIPNHMWIIFMIPSRVSDVTSYVINES